MIKQSRRLTIARFVGAATCAGPVLLWILSGCSFPNFDGERHRTNEDLIDHFRAHRSEFERLLAMAEKDKGLTRVDVDRTQPDDPSEVGLTSERVAEYRDAFHTLGILHGLSVSSDGTDIEFIMSTQGWVAHGSSKSYIHCKRCQSRIGSLTRIEGDWYIHYYED